MRADIRSLVLEPDPRTLPEDPAEFAFLATLSVGPSEGPGEETFGVNVLSLLDTPSISSERSTSVMAKRP